MQVKNDRLFDKLNRLKEELKVSVRKYVVGLVWQLFAIGS